MNIELISGLLDGSSSSKIHPMGKGGIPQSARPGANGLGEDNIELSKIAKSIYGEEGGKIGDARGFGDRFRLALIQFTGYALHINGFVGAPNALQAWSALNILAEKSQIPMPSDIIEAETREELLKAFKSEWDLDEGASVDDIFKTMVRVFGEDRSYTKPGPAAAGTEDSGSPGKPEEFAAGIHSVTGNLGTPGEPPAGIENLFQRALHVFTSKHFQLGDIRGESEEEAQSRVLNVLVDKLGISSSDEAPTASVSKALGLEAGHTLPGVIRSISEVFFS